MWPFTSRGSRDGTTAPEPSDLPPFELFARNDARLKLWLTGPLSERINWLSNKLEASRPDVLRALLFEHLYGRVAYEALKVYVRQHNSAQELQRSRQAAALRDRAVNGIDAALHERTADRGGPRYSARDVTPIDIRFTGKASDDFTLELPTLLKEDLTTIARKHGLTPSSYARKMLVLQLLGERVHTDWQKAIGRLPSDVERLERD